MRKIILLMLGIFFICYNTMAGFLLVDEYKKSFDIKKFDDSLMIDTTHLKFNNFKLKYDNYFQSFNIRCTAIAKEHTGKYRLSFSMYLVFLDSENKIICCCKLFKIGTWMQSDEIEEISTSGDLSDTDFNKIKKIYMKIIVQKVD